MPRRGFKHRLARETNQDLWTMLRDGIKLLVRVKKVEEVGR